MSERGHQEDVPFGSSSDAGKVRSCGPCAVQMTSVIVPSPDTAGIMPTGISVFARNGSRKMNRTQNDGLCVNMNAVCVSVSTSG